MIYIEKILWAAATILLFTSGMYFTFKLKFVQFKIKSMIASFKNNDKQVGISPFQTLAMTLGARIGVGNLAGIALAIHYGGVGTIFWIWISTIICSTNAFSESVLGVLYREKDKDEYVGGPSYYISKGMKKRKLGKLYAVFLIIAYIVGFLTVQSNAIVKSVTKIYSIDPIIISLLVSILTILIIFKGLKSIANFSSKLVPFMSIAYTLVCLYIVLLNINQLPNIITSIIVEAFHPSSMAIGIITPIIIGFQRGTFSNEAGLGTGAIASATANTDSPTKQGLIQVLGIYIETLILSSLTTFVIMLSNYKDITWNNINGIEITQAAFVYHLGDIGNYIVMITLFLFAFSTIITGYYYGESNLKYLFHKIGNKRLLLFKIVVIFILLLGGILSPRLIWLLADILIVGLGLINVYALFSLRKDVINEYKYYRYKKKWYN
jgi:AGCS family alanine or glycine:cation symporter